MVELLDRVAGYPGMPLLIRYATVTLRHLWNPLEVLKGPFNIRYN